MTSREIIAIIPARGQSKGVHRKNIRPLAGKPLIAYTIEAAMNAKIISRTIVSTEDNEIAHTSRKLGAEIIQRPMELAGDTSTAIDVAIHVLDTLQNTENHEPETIILLQPTSPLRTAQDIEKALDLYEAIPCESLISVVEYQHSLYWALKLENDYLVPLFGNEFTKTRRQDLPQAYSPNGAIFIAPPDALRKNRSFYCDHSVPFIMDPENSVDIDSELDFLIAECLIRKRASNHNQ